MRSGIIALLFVPIFIGLTWLYTSPLSGIKLGSFAKALLRIALFVAIFGGILAQVNYLATNEPPSTRNFCGGLCVLLEIVPIIFILFYRYYKDPSRSGSYRSNDKRAR